MIRHLAAIGFALTLLAGLPGAQAQFADETQSLFTGDPDAPKTENDILIFDLDNRDEDEPAAGGSSGAQTVEELCCQMSKDERAGDGLCFDVQCPE